LSRVTLAVSFETIEGFSHGARPDLLDLNARCFHRFNGVGTAPAGEQYVNLSISQHLCGLDSRSAHGGSIFCIVDHFSNGAVKIHEKNVLSASKTRVNLRIQVSSQGCNSYVHCLLRDGNGSTV
jgi:hypothetical protein